MIPKLKHPSKTELPELSWTAVTRHGEFGVYTVDHPEYLPGIDSVSGHSDARAGMVKSGRSDLVPLRSLEPTLAVEAAST